MKNLIPDLSGKIFGNLVVLKEQDKSLWKTNIKEYICMCSCENKTIVSVKQYYLTGGQTTSCGCLTKKLQYISHKKYNDYDMGGSVGIGYTRKKEEFYFDKEDFDKIKDFCWATHKSHATKYIVARDVNNKEIIMHRLIMGFPDSRIDHIDRNGMNNCKNNLRLASNIDNCHNRGECKRNTSGRNGVSFRKDNKKYRVRIVVNRKEYNIGHYNNFEEAVEARRDAEKKYYGEFARND